MAAAFAGWWWMYRDESQVFYPERPLPLLTSNQSARWPSQKPKRYWVHFWASWCAPCLTELPKFHANVNSNDRVDSEDPIFIVSTDESANKAIDALEKIQVNPSKSRAIWVLDSEEYWSKGIGTYLFPETYFVDLENQKVQKWVGPQDWDKIFKRE